MPKRAVLTLILSLTCCVSLPGPSDSGYRDAIGYVSVSTPTFTPISGTASGDRALQFGSLRDETKLAELIDKPAAGITQLSYEGLRAALKARFAGEQFSSTESNNRSASDATTSVRDAAGSLTRTDERRQADEYTQEKNRTFSSPSAPDAVTDSDYIDTPNTVQERMWELLKRSDIEYTVAPSVKAALVAAYKLQMVNMEEYYNLEGFSFDGRAASEFLPYKVHFTATAEPGWYTTYHPYDAVAELKLGDPDDYKVLAVMPSETAQTLDQLTSSLHKLQLALDLEGTFRSASARTQVQYVREAVQRLEGLRVQRDTIVGGRIPGKLAPDVARS